MPETQPSVSRQPRLDGVARIIAVASGKGGVGKSTVAANLAVALQSLGRRVGLADVDIYGPSAPMMFGVSELPRPDPDKRLMHPVDAYGVQIMSMGFFLDDQAPVVWRGPMAMSATKQFLRGVAWGELDYLIVDLPPGTGDIPLTLAQEVPLDGGVIVTTPQDVALADVTRGVAMFRRLSTPILGVVVNMSGYVCPQCGTRDELFGTQRSEEISRAIGAPVLAEVPIDARVCETGDAGRPIVLSEPSHPASVAFLSLARSVEDSLGKLRADLYGPEPVDISRDDAARIVRVRWSDDVTTSYTYSGLRGWCPCAQCQGHSGQTRFVEVDDPMLVGHEGVGRYAIRFLWADGHSTGMYSYDWLREIADFAECRPDRGGGRA
ncbi:MAG TPA: P-loop NTPase [Candidatus Binatia bacterium]|nr:P-loop NTPase [Candidatus Binatia bacterium]